MGVDEPFRSPGAGYRLLAAAIAEFYRRHVHSLLLESNSSLKPALHMCERAGCVLQPALRTGSRYALADVCMPHAQEQAVAHANACR
jgi:hypothetical protein